MKGSKKDAKPDKRNRTMSRATFFEVEILDCKKLQLCFLDKVEPNATVGEIKSLLHKYYPKWYPARQSLTLHPYGKSLRDGEVLENLPVGTTATMYFQDLGPQLGWTMVFLCESIGPLFLYLMFYFRLPNIYLHKDNFTASPFKVVKLACLCHSFYYIKRLFEIIFIHRFSHGTMALQTIMRFCICMCEDCDAMEGSAALIKIAVTAFNAPANCLYYWGFAAWLAYYINHPLYTPPLYGKLQIYSALVMFVLCESGSFSVHLVLNQLGCNASRPKSIPYPTKNPFTWLFFFVSCPNYTYEVGTWVSFSIMTQCVPAALFVVLGFVQRAVWAREKHDLYTGEFISYPELRSAIVPLFL